MPALVTTDLINARLGGRTLGGAVDLPNNAGVGLVFDDGTVLSVRVGTLLTPEQSEGVLEVVRRRLRRKTFEPDFLPQETVAEREGRLDDDRAARRRAVAEQAVLDTLDV